MLADDKVKMNKYVTDEEWCHIRVGEKCGECSEFACEICPGQVFQKTENGAMLVLYHQCLECGGCEYLCPHGEIEFSFPRGGYGIVHRYG